MSVLRSRTLAEMDRRLSMLPDEIAWFEAAATANTGGFGIHATQVSVLKLLMSVLLQRQRELVNRLGKDISDADFAEGMGALFEEMAGAQKVWNVFLQAFTALHRPELAPHLDTANLVAAECYQLCVAQARNFGALDTDELREPPLVCPEAFTEPISLGRHALVGTLGAFCDAGWRFHDLRLPIPLVLVPIDQVGCVWLLPTLCHEVGHDIDKDLGLAAEIEQVLASMPSIAPSRQAVWRRWCVEVLADAFGVLLGHAGFAEALSAQLLVLAPGARYRALDTTLSHPHPLLRIPLVAAMLRRLGIPALADAASKLVDGARFLSAPQDLAPFVEDVDTLAGAVLEAKLSALHGHALSELNPDLAADVRRAGALADFLGSGVLRPAPDKPSRFPYRLVPTAAQIAVSDARPDPPAIDAIRQRAADFVAAIPRPAFLAGGRQLTVKRATFLTDLARNIDFGAGG